MKLVYRVLGGCLVVASVLLSQRIMAQPALFLNNSPANFEYYTPGETVSTLFTTVDTDNIYFMQIKSQFGDSPMKPTVASQSQHPPNIKVYTIHTYIPADFVSNDSIFVLEVSSSTYGFLTVDFKVKPASLDVSTDNSSNRPQYCTVYPNPSDNMVTIETSIIDDQTRVSVVDALGKTVSAEMVAKVISEKLTLDVSSLPSGQYFIELITTNGGFVKPFIVH